MLPYRDRRLSAPPLLPSGINWPATIFWFTYCAAVGAAAAMWVTQ